MSAPPKTQRELAFAILGPLRVTRAGAVVALGGRQQRAILARLLVAGAAGTSVEQLADMLWGERAPSGFVTTIQTYVFHLRKVLEPERGRGTPGEVLVTENGRYRLAIPPDAVDVEQFKRAADTGQQLLAAGDAVSAASELRRGLALWRGEVLSDLADFDFVAPFAARLDEQRLAALEAAIDCELLAGHHAAVIGELDELIAQHPLREQLYERQMLALYRAGRQSEALNSFDRLRHELRDELGVDPGEPVQRLHQQVLTHDPALDMQLPPDSDRPAPASAPDPQHRRRLSRRRLMVTCAVAVAGVVAGTAAVVISQTPRSSLRTLPPNSVGVIAADGSLHDAVSVGQNPGGIAYGAGSIWVTNTSDGTVSRINPRTHAVIQKIPVGGQPAGVAVTGDGVWVANSGDGTVTRINALADRAVGVPIPVGNAPSAIAAGSSGVWVANRNDDTIQRINPTTGTAGLPIPVGEGPNGLALDGRTVWVANGRTATLSRIDTDAHSLVPDETDVGAGPAGVAVTQKDVWVANQGDATVDRIDRASGQQKGIPVGQGPNSIVATSSAVWVANEFDGTVTQIDPGPGDVRRTISIGAIPAGLAVVDGKVWVATRAFGGAGHRGGTLTVLGPDIAIDDSVDPNDSYSPFFAETERAVYDGLVAFRPVGGVPGLTLVPDLATRIPRAANGGRTYAFTLREGIRYSDGSAVLASDFRRSLERALVLPYTNTGLYASIVGARACIDRPAKPCDLGRGIETDDKAGRVIFHLAAPDPLFLYDLTLFVYAIPPTAPRAKELTAPPPGTGPYQIVDYAKRKGYTLVRNPYFHQWSFAAQPDGYPDVIKFQKTSSQQAERGVLSGAGDVFEIGSGAFLGQTGEVIESLNRQHPALLHSDPWLQTDLEWLNTRVPPFNNKLARQAVNHATDRNELVKRLGGSQMATPTCQLLPRNFPGYEYRCPFGVTGTDGGYTGPDLAKARALVARSGTLGAPVTVDVVTDPTFGPFTNYFAELLPKLGYRVTVRKQDPATADPFYRDSRNKVQIAWADGWIADYPASYNFYDPILSCASFSPADPTNLNVGEFCDPDIDAIARKAHSLDATDPTTAKALWREVDRAVTDASPAIFTLTRRLNTLTSRRVGNYTRTLQGILVFDQLWVQ
ncbi:MAG TPA: ABC transporter substrate-binding protein [Jatrophihabitantaceae bacterium]|jgi:YVTN family beta-propeller protein